jgi:SAM-dependent methyltransferase
MPAPDFNLLVTMDLVEQFGGIDIYLFDQLLRGRIPSGTRLLDAGCGGGRNLVYFLRNGYEVFGVDHSAEAISQVRGLAASINPALPAENFAVAAVEEMPFPHDHFGAVVSSAVLHFARDAAHFRAMLDEMWRVLTPGGLFFARLASSIGIEKLINPIGAGRYLLPDGSERFLVDEAALVSAAREMGAAWLDPLKTTNVQNQRCMTTWVLRKVEGRGTVRAEG